MTVKEKIIIALLSTNRPGIEGLIKYMEQIGYFEAPCSGGNHLAKEGGLAEHSWNVNGMMRAMQETVISGDCEIPDYSIDIVSLLHDLGKCGDYGKPNYVENWIKDGRPTKAEPEQKYKISESKPYKTNPDLLYVPHEVRSVKIASQFIHLTEYEEQAILFHNGLYGDFRYAIQGKETPLYLLLHFADMWASRVMEVEEVEDGNRTED
jgi:23S rRNA maturation-related 3'-5' exoribonuclease YhaM